jgi:hypothetical protein
VTDEGDGSKDRTEQLRLEYLKDDLQTRTPLVSILSLQRIARNCRAVVGPASFLGTYALFPGAYSLSRY